MELEIKNQESIASTVLKKTLCVFMTVLMLVSSLGSTLSAFAVSVVDSGVCGADGDNVTWVLYSDGELVISGEGEMDKYVYVAPPWYAYKSDILNVKMEYGITSIGECAFSGLNITDFTIPDSVTYIYGGFSDCYRLTNIVIPFSVNYIGEASFSDCFSLADVYYAGTEEQWNRIEIEQDNVELTNSTIHFNSTGNVTDGNVTGGNVTGGNVSDGNVTGGNVTNGNISDGNVAEYAISAGETKEIKIQANEITYIKFIPEVSGTYKFYSTSYDDAYGYLYDADKNEITHNDDYGESCNFSITHELEAGVTYYWGARFYEESDSGKFNVTLECVEVRCSHENRENVEAVEPTCTTKGYTEGIKCLDCGKVVSGCEEIAARHTDENADDICDLCERDLLSDILPGETKEIEIVSKEITYLKFTPPVSGVYKFYSTSDSDTYGYLYDADKDEITSDDDDGAGNNFSISYELEEGVTYYWGARYYNRNSSGKFNVTLTIVAEIDSIVYTPVKPFEFIDKISMVEIEDEDTWDSVYGYKIGFSAGDKIEVSYVDGIKEVYTASGDYWRVRFVSEDGKELNDVKLVTNQSSENIWGVGVHYADLYCLGETISVPVTVTESPIKEISATYKYSLYKDYDCKIGDSFSRDEYGDVWGNLNEDDIICKIKYNDDNEFIGNIDEVIGEIGYNIAYSIGLDSIGENIGNIHIGGLFGDFVINIEEEVPEGKTPSARNIAYGARVIYGEPLNLQLLEFADMGYKHNVTLLKGPDSVFVDSDGHLTGSYESTDKGVMELYVEVRWENSYAHQIIYIPIYPVVAESKIELPDDATVAPFNKDVEVDYSDNGSKWYKFVCVDSFILLNSSDWDSIKSFELYNKDGYLVDRSGYGGGGAMYELTYGEVYYIHATGGESFTLVVDEWLPSWKGENLGETSKGELIGSNVEKIFEGDTNTRWNVYKYTDKINHDFYGDFSWERVGSMTRFASPVNIHSETELLEINKELLYSVSYKYDPNNIEECEEIGASTTQKTMKDELREGEKEYRFDNVYYMIPEVESLKITEERTVYVPVGYYIEDSHVVKCTEHKDKIIEKENVVESTCSKEGSYTEVAYCPICDVEVSREVKTIPVIAHNYDTVVTAPTCTAEGYTTYTCACGDTYTADKVDALGHDEISHPAKVPTCTEIGWNEYVTCSRCDYTTYEEIKAVGHDYKSVVTAPTCTADGYTTYTCACGDTYTADKVDALGHDEISHAAKAPTCTEIGWNAYVTCSRCDYTTYEEISATGHNYKSVVTAPTCTEGGYTTHVCTKCNNGYSDAFVNAAGHTEVIDAAVEPTCTSTGLTEGKHCSVCGEIFVAQEPVPALAHNWDDGVIDPDSTCTSEGVKTFTCTACGETRTEVVSLKGHTEDEAVTENVVSATCTTNGSYDTVVYCSVCNAELSRKTTIVDALGHGEIAHAAKAPTCTEIGWNEYVTCSRCDYTTYAEISATGHDYKSVVTAPTCTAEGYTTYTCACGDTYTADKVAAKGHNETILKSVTATCTKTGLTEGKKCSVCGTVTVVQQTVAKKAHNLTTLKAVAATCTKTGLTEGKKCSVCGTVTVAQKTVAKKAHTYKNVTTKATLMKNGKVESKCSVCGEVSKTTTVYYPKTIKLSATSYTYNGKAKKPTVTVKDSKGNTLKKDTDYTVKYASGRKNPGKYTVTVTFKGKYSGTKKLTFTIKPAKVTLSKLTAGSKQLTVTWKTVTAVTGYEVQYSTSSNFSSKTTKKTTVKSSKTKKTTIKKLKKGKKYYVKVRAYKIVDGKKIYGAWSSVKSVKIK